MQQHEIDHLIDKYLNGTASASERERLLHWYRSQNEQSVEWQSTFQQEKDVIKDRVLARLKKQIKSEKPVLKLRVWYQVAAAVGIIVVAALGVWYYQSQRLPDSLIVNARFKNDIPHGGRKATLRLSDGSEISLESSNNGLVGRQGNVAINQSKGGTIIYDLNRDGSGTSAVNTVSTPKGGEFQVVLSDGTKVWLNSGSSITFPAAFSGTERRVRVDGEVYFEVAKNKKKPFRVDLKNMQIEVLGTHFNVMAYQDERNAATTLVEGSVMVKTMQGESSENRILAPGEQASFSNDRLKINQVDVEEVTAWKNGYFMFNNENIQSVMRKLARWYNVEVIYEGNVSSRAIWGTVSRLQNASQVLTMLEMTGTIHFKIEGRRITVMP